MTDALDVKEFVAGYLAEAEEHLSAANRNLLSIDAALRIKENDPRGVRELFRNLHTLKGLSAMVGAEPIVDIAHEMESLLRSADRAGGRLPAHAIDAVSKGLRVIEQRVANLAKGETLPPAPKDLVEALASLQIDSSHQRPSGELSLAPELLAKLSLAEKEQLLLGIGRGRRAISVEFVPSEARAADGLTITSTRERVAKVAEIVKVLPRSVRDPEGGTARVAFLILALTSAADDVVLAAAAALPSQLQIIGAEVAATSESAFDDDDHDDARAAKNFVRVDVGRLDDALERLSALAIMHSRMQIAMREMTDSRTSLRNMTNIVAENGRKLRDLRSAIMRARMVPVSDLLDRAPLLVRGLSRASNKIVRLTIDAGRSELDKAVADRLFAVIVHLLRNAVDHAIETPDERRGQGKPEEGHIQVVCFDRSDSRLELTVTDDGRGVSRERIAARADAPVPQNDVELLALMTRPGLSTMDRATHTSGRGLGMDIVKRIVVDELGGELRVRSTPRLGTCFTLITPLSVAVVDVFSFMCEGRRFVVPVSAVDELTEIAPDQVSEAPRPNGGLPVRLLKHRGSTLPLFALSALLGLPPTLGARPKAMIVRRNSDAYAVEVDAMLGQQDVVIRSLHDPLVDVEGVAGSTDLGDGSPTLVLDLTGLLHRAQAAARSALS